MSSKTQVTRVSIDIPKVDHKKLKTLAAAHDQSMRAFILDLIENQLGCNKSHSPNKQTQATLKNINKRKNLVVAKDTKDMFKKLGI